MFPKIVCGILWVWDVSSAELGWTLIFKRREWEKADAGGIVIFWSFIYTPMAPGFLNKLPKYKEDISYKSFHQFGMLYLSFEFQQNLWTGYGDLYELFLL